MALENVMAVIDGKVVAPSVAVGPTWEDNNALGAKNLIPYPWEQTTYNNPGITWTDNGDGTWYANGTSTATDGEAIRWRDKIHDYILPTGEYWLSGCPEGGSPDMSTYYVWVIIYHQDNTYTDYLDIGDGIKVTISDTDVYMRGGIAVFPGAGAVTNLLFKPMLRRIEDPDGTYEPYAKTNRQLTKEMLMMKPNLWTPGVEYDFGDGVYGQRFKGTKTGNELAGANNLVTGVAKTAQVLNSGGMVDMSGTAGTNWYNTSGVWDSGSGGVYRPLFTNSNQTLQFYCKNNQGITTGNIQYDIWMIYTKQ